MASGADFNRLEELRARRDGADLVKNSGRGMRKGDARRGSFLIDYKFTEKKSYALNIEAVNAFSKQAYSEGYTPVIVAVFEEHKSRAIAMIDWDLLMEMHDRIKELEEYEWMYKDLCQ